MQYGTDERTDGVCLSTRVWFCAGIRGRRAVLSLFVFCRERSVETLPSFFLADRAAALGVESSNGALFWLIVPPSLIARQFGRTFKELFVLCGLLL